MGIIALKHTAIPRSTRFILSLAAAGSLLLLPASPVWAHAHPTEETPAPDSSVASPAQACVVFDDPIETALSHLNVLDAKGTQVNTAKASFQQDNKQMCVELPALSAGKYQVKWVVVARDGHRAQGGYAFAVK